MSTVNKARGTRFETAAVDYLNKLGVKARRLPRHGALDIGDMEIPLGDDLVLVVELKDEKTIRLSEYLRQADVEAENYAKRHDKGAYAAALVKRRGKGPGQAYLVFELDEGVALLREQGII